MGRFAGAEGVGLGHDERAAALGNHLRVPAQCALLNVSVLALMLMLCVPASPPLSRICMLMTSPGALNPDESEMIVDEDGPTEGQGHAGGRLQRPTGRRTGQERDRIGAEAGNIVDAGLGRGDRRENQVGAGVSGALQLASLLHAPPDGPNPRNHGASRVSSSSRFNCARGIGLFRIGLPRRRVNQDFSHRPRLNENMNDDLSDAKNLKTRMKTFVRRNEAQVSRRHRNP